MSIALIGSRDIKTLVREVDDEKIEEATRAVRCRREVILATRWDQYHNRNVSLSPSTLLSMTNSLIILLSDQRQKRAQIYMRLQKSRVCLRFVT